MIKEDLQQDRIVILDFGSQYTQLIARRVREIGVFCDILPFDIDIAQLIALKPKGIILSGGPKSTYEAKAYSASEVFGLSIPILGICYGMQMMAFTLGGQVENGQAGEYGQTLCTITKQSVLFSDIDVNELDVWMSHGDCVSVVPKDFDALAASTHAPIAAMENTKRSLYALQFHPEVTHTDQGSVILKNFVLKICHCEQTWQLDNIIDITIKDIRRQVGNQRIILGLSGGVDSSVTAVLLQKALGDQLISIFVDNGLLRHNEAADVINTFGGELGLKLIHVNAKKRFFEALKGVSDPEQKRKIIGGLFIDIFEEEAKKLQGVKFLAQGTIYPDIIESSTGDKTSSEVIKSHHNVGGLPDRMNLALVEPLKALFKDEVRSIGHKLGLPKSLINRHPFPGPALAVRVLGEVKEEYITILRHADRIFMETLKAANWYDQLAQAFCVFLPVKSVGVVGDKRNYAYVISLRAVKSVDFMSADAADLPFELLQKVANRIVNEVAGVSRVTYDITSKPPATIEWE